MVYLPIIILCFILQTVANKEVGRRFEPSMAGMYFYCAVGMSLIPLGLLPLGGLALSDSRTLLIAGLFGVGFSLTLVLMILTMREGPLSLSSLFFGLAVILPVLSGLLFFGEKLTAVKSAGLACVLAVVIYTGAVGDSGGKPVSRKWLRLALLSLVCSGMMSVLLKVQTHWLGTADSLSFTLYGFFATALCFWALLVVKVVPMKLSLGPWLKPAMFICSLGLGVSTLFGNWLLLLALDTVPAVVVFPITTGGLVAGSWLLSFLVYREKFTVQKLAGMVVGLAGIVLLNL